MLNKKIPATAGIFALWLCFCNWCGGTAIKGFDFQLFHNFAHGNVCIIRTKNKICTRYLRTPKLNIHVMKSRLFKKINFLFSSLLVLLLHLPFVFAKAKTASDDVYIGTRQLNIPVEEQLLPFSQQLTDSCQTVNIYDSLRLSSFGLARQVFDYAMAGFNALRETGRINNDNIISIADFSKPSFQKRLFVIDLKNYRVLFNTYVAHGMNSGREYANSFSNTPESNKSSLGFYTTLNTYSGKHGYSLHLQGIEKGINDKAYDRDIVIHGADYVSESKIRQQGFIGRSQGCPAIPERLNKPVIDKIKDGTCLFIFGHDKKYFLRSALLKNINRFPAVAVK